MKRLLTIQDISCVGQCSTTVALPLISACGVECAVLPPAILSNHTGGFKSWSFADLTGELRKVEEQWIKQGIRFDAFYTGYVCESHIDPILSIMESCANPGAVRIVDPAMADNGVLYKGFAPDFPSRMARLVKGADYVLPNLTEAALLTGEDPSIGRSGQEAASPVREANSVCGEHTLTGAAASSPRLAYERLISKLHELGAKNVILTGVSFKDDELGSAISDGRSVVYDFNPKLNRMSHGTGDVFASVFAGAILRGKSAADAAALAADIVCSAIKATDDGHWYGVSFEKAIPELVETLESKGEK